MSANKPDLRVEVPHDDSGPSTQPSDGSSGNGSSKWGRYLQSPGQVIGQAMEKTASKLTGGGSGKRSNLGQVTRNRITVEPYRRAAMDAQYRTNQQLRQVRAWTGIQAF